MEDMDVTDKNFRPCKCGYQICLFCYRHIKDDLNGLCPACRTPYDEANVTFVTPDPQECAACTPHACNSACCVGRPFALHAFLSLAFFAQVVVGRFALHE